MTLIDRLSKLEGPDDDFDAEIAMQVCGFTRTNLMEAHPEEKPLWEYFDQERNRIGRHGPMIPSYTASLDAAIALAERVLPGCRGDVEFGKPDDEGLYCARIYLTDRAFKDFHKVPAIALCIAILRAKEASEL